MFIDRSKFRKQLLKRVAQGTFLWNYFKIWPVVSEEKNFEEFLWSPHRAKSPPHSGHVFRGIIISRTTFEKGHTRNNLVKLFQILTCNFLENFFLKFLCVCIVQNAPIYQNHVYSRIKLSQTTFEKGHLRKIPVKLFQNLTIAFREDYFLKIFFKNFFMSVECKKPPSPKQCLWTNKNFVNNFWKVSNKGTFLWNYFIIGPGVFISV